MKTKVRLVEDTVESLAIAVFSLVVSGLLAFGMKALGFKNIIPENNENLLWAVIIFVVGTVLVIAGCLVSLLFAKILKVVKVYKVKETSDDTQIEIGAVSFWAIVAMLIAVLGIIGSMFIYAIVL